MSAQFDLSEMSAPQRAFFLSRARHICYGGARGGGKSWAMRKKLELLAINYPGINILLLRRTLPELRENHVMPMLRDLHGIAKYNATDKTFSFQNGARIVAGYCASEADVLRYQGQEYDVIGMEEATHFTEEQMQFLTTCNRTAKPGFRPRMYYTCNPGNVGHAWVKRLFIDRAYRGREQAEDYAFIPARVWDNRPLMERNPEYVDTLANLPEDLRRAYLDGDWDVFAGQYFTEFRRSLHVCDPFEIPAHWTRYCALDYGLDMLAAIWCAFDDAGNAYVYRELCRENAVISDAAHRIISAGGSDRIVCTYAPADMWGRNRATGKAQAEMFAAEGLPLTMVRNARVDGWLALKEWLRPLPDGTGGQRAKLCIFSTCTRLIHDLPLLQHDAHNPTDVATEPHDITHAPDALRYLFDGRPRHRIALPAEGGLDGIGNFLEYGG